MSKLLGLILFGIRLLEFGLCTCVNIIDVLVFFNFLENRLRILNFFFKLHFKMVFSKTVSGNFLKQFLF